MMFFSRWKRVIKVNTRRLHTYFQRCNMLLQSSWKHNCSLWMVLWRKQNKTMWAMWWVHWWMWSKLDFCSRAVNSDPAARPANQVHLAGRIPHSLSCVALHWLKKKKRGEWCVLLRTSSWHLTSCWTELPYFCCTVLYFHSEHDQAVSATRSGPLSHEMVGHISSVRLSSAQGVKESSMCRGA